jgi:CheY-like chemotaxis protein
MVNLAKVLVVDDDINLRRIVSLFLRNANFEVIEAKNGKEAIEMAVSQGPDLVLLDVMMPVMNGFEVCRVLKMRQETKDIPIIMCTARSTKEDLVEAIKGGADSYIVKPFTKDVLLRKVEEMLGLRAERRLKETTILERRGARRKEVEWSLSWGSFKETKIPTIYKSRIINISSIGLAFEFPRCSTCTGYEQGTVHPQCILANYAARFKESKELDLLISSSENTIIESKGKIAHIYQPLEFHHKEIVGIGFTVITEQARKVIESSLSERE